MLHKYAAGVAAALCLTLGACFGVKSDVAVNGAGGGEIALEYSVDAALLALGALDGNAAYPSIPVGEEDFQRAADRIEGLSLKNFASEKAGDDVLYKVRLEFDSLSALAAFMDGQGLAFTVSEEGGKSALRATFAPGDAGDAAQLAALMPEIFAGRRFEFAMRFPRPCTVRFFDGRGSELTAPPAGEVKLSLAAFSFSAPMAELFSAPEGLALEAAW